MLFNAIGVFLLAEGLFQHSLRQSRHKSEQGTGGVSRWWMWGRSSNVWQLAWLRTLPSPDQPAAGVRCRDPTAAFTSDAYGVFRDVLTLPVPVDTRPPVTPQ